jgi:hypothetical protein
MRPLTASVRTNVLLTDGQRTAAWLRNARERFVQQCHSLHGVFVGRDPSVGLGDPSVGLPASMFGSAAASVGHAPRFLTASLASELGILLALSVMFPFLIHILPVPDDARLGPRLLPIFYAPLLAALLGRTRSALIVALAAPWLNWALTTHPAPRGALVVMLQLLVFVFVLRALLTRVGSRWFLAAPAFLSGMAAAALATAIFPALIGGRPALEWAAQSVVIGLPGIAVLVLINWLAVRYYPSGPTGGGPVGA